jgi:hypothetical protein
MEFLFGFIFEITFQDLFPWALARPWPGQGLIASKGIQTWSVQGIGPHHEIEINQNFHISQFLATSMEVSSGCGQMAC